MHWTDTRDIAEQLQQEYPLDDPRAILFTDLRRRILALSEFNDDPKHCNERILESVQMLWIEVFDEEND